MISWLSGFLGSIVEGNVFSTEAVEADQAARVREMLHQGAFAPFPELTERKGFYPNECWMDQLQRIANGEMKEGLLAAYFFCLAIDQRFTDEQKRQIISQSCLLLDKSKLENQCYSYVDGLPSIMSVHILRYSSEMILDHTIQTLLGFRISVYCEEYLYKLIKATLHTSWPQEEKCVLIDRILRTLPSNDVDELLCYMHLEAAREDLAAFLTLCPVSPPFFWTQICLNYFLSFS